MSDFKPAGAAPINQVLADNLSRLMRERELTQMALAAKAGMGQTTVSLYLSPERRAAGKSGKEPSAKLSEVQRLADALGVELWRLLQPQPNAAQPAGLSGALLQELAQAPKSEVQRLENMLRAHFGLPLLSEHPAAVSQKQPRRAA